MHTIENVNYVNNLVFLRPGTIRKSNCNFFFFFFLSEKIDILKLKYNE